MKAKKRKLEHACWSAEDHAMREQSRRDKSDKAQHRRAVLTHETQEKRDAIKLRLHITKTQRRLNELKRKLIAWDPTEEETKEPAPQKPKGRKGPETWKLRGAARPAWQIYDFDTRYVDPHVQAHVSAAEKTKRSLNLLALYKGRLGSAPATAMAREYLALLMQLGHLSFEAKQYKTARETWLKCIELEGDEDPITTAREDLMRMHVRLERYDAALRLGERLKGQADSVCIQYSLALASFKLKQETTEKFMVEAIRGNPFCAFYLAFGGTFNNVMEYTDDLHEAEDETQSSLDEAIEYCSAEVELWAKSGAALELRRLVQMTLHGQHSQLSKADIEWKQRLSRIEEEYKASRAASGMAEKQEGESPKLPDVSMYAGMFRTAMEMLDEASELGQPAA